MNNLSIQKVKELFQDAFQSIPDCYQKEQLQFYMVTSTLFMTPLVAYQLSIGSWHACWKDNSWQDI